MPGTGLPIERRRPSLLDPPPMVQTPVVGSMAVGQALERIGAVGMAAADRFERMAREVEHAERVRYVTDLTLAAREKRIELAALHPDDPAKFSNAWRGYADGVLGGVDLRYADHARQALEGERLAVLDNITERAAAKSKALAADSIKALTGAAENDILSAAYQGGVNSPQFADAFRKAEAAQMDGVTAGLWSEDSARLRLDTLRGKAQGEAVIGSLERTYRTGGKEAALSDLEAFRRAQNIALDPAERERIVNRGETFIRMWEADRSAGLTEVRATATELKKAADLGTASEQAVIDTAARLEALGDRAGAATLRRSFGRQEVMANVASMPEAEHERLLQGLRASPGRPLVDRIIGAESGGDPNARNPNSTATGAGQFINSTWLDTVRRHAPEVAAGKTDEQILALRTDPQLSRRMVEAHAAENRDELAAAGLPSDDGAAYLAHFAGIGGAKSLLRADPSTPVEQVLSAGAIQANGFLRGKTAGDVVAWASRKMAGGGPDPELVRDLETSLTRKREALRADPLGYAAQLRGAPALTPINWDNPDAAAATLQQRQTFARTTSAMFSTGTVPPLTRAEIDGLKGRYDDADAAGKTRILGTLARSLDGRHLAATLEKIAPDRPVFAWAGGLYSRSPDLAESIVRGDAALKLDPKVAPKDDEATRSTVNSLLGTAMQNLPQARAAALASARARYADLSAAAGDFSGVLDAGRMEQAINDVTGGVVDWNPSSWSVGGGKVVPPKPGMSASDFGKLMDSLTDDDVAGAVTGKGTAIKADDVRRLANLEDAGTGRYLLRIGGGYARTADGQPYVLDLGRKVQ